MKGEAYVKGWINMFSKPIFCLKLVNQSCVCFFPFDDLFFFFIYRLEITKFYMSFFIFFLFLPRLMFPQSSFKVHPFRFLGILIYLKRGLFIEKNYFEQFTGRVEMGYFTTSESQYNQ